MVRIEPGLRDAIRRMAKATRLRQQDIVEDALRAHLKIGRSPKLAKKEKKG